MKYKQKKLWFLIKMMKKSLNTGGRLEKALKIARSFPELNVSKKGKVTVNSLQKKFK